MNVLSNPGSGRNLNIKKSIFDGIVRLSVEGRIVRLGNSQELAEEIKAACDIPLGRVIEIDLTGVPLMDVAGVNTLVAGLARAERAGLEFRVKPSPFIATTLRICHLYELLVEPVTATQIRGR